MSPITSTGPFLDLCLKLSLKTEVVARTYEDGVWRQISGIVMWSHLGRSEASWHDLFPNAGHMQQPALIFFCHNSYTSLVAALGAILGGFDVIFWDPKIPLEIFQKKLTNQGQVVGFVTEFDTKISQLKDQGIPVINIASLLWSPQDAHAGPSCQFTLGRFGFWNESLEFIDLNRLVLVAQQFTQHIAVPKKIFWNTLHLTSLVHPFRFVGLFATLLKNGTLSFLSPECDLKDHLSILNPTVLFIGPDELSALTHRLSNLADDTSQGLVLRFPLLKGLNRLDSLFSNSKMLKVPEGVLDFLQRSFLKASRFAAKWNRHEASLEKLSFVVHGPSPARRESVQPLAKLGVPVIETYSGPIAGGGIMASHVYDAPHTEVIGPALPHVNFRLGAGSFLEYQLLKPISQVPQDEKVWHSTGDKVQMTPLGFRILKKKSDRRKHVD